MFRRRRAPPGHERAEEILGVAAASRGRPLRQCVRDGDGLVCSATLRLFGRPVGRILTDNAIGGPTIFPPDPCRGVQKPNRVRHEGC
jgi:hypothetical protein